MQEGIPRILVVDFDNTIAHQVSYPDISTTRFGNRIVHAYIRHKKRRGWYIIVNTARHGEALETARGFLERNGIPYDLMNDNHPALNEMYGETRKITGERTLDDMQIGLVGWLLRHFC